MVWKNKMVLMGIPITKELAYGIFMKQIIFEIKENGQLNRLIKKWTVPKPDCRPLHKEGKPLSLEKIISLFIISMIGIFIAIIIIIIEKIFHAHKPRKHVSIKEANNMNLQRFFMKLQKKLNDEVFFLESPITKLLKEMQNHIDLLVDAEAGKSPERKEVEYEQQQKFFYESENPEIPGDFIHNFSDPVQDDGKRRKIGKIPEHVDLSHVGVPYDIEQIFDNNEDNGKNHENLAKVTI